MLFEQITKERDEARVAGDKMKLLLLGTLIGEATKTSKTPSDEVVQATVKKFIKGAEETLKVLFDKGINVLSAAETKQAKEIAILETYLPSQLSETEINSIISGLQVESVGSPIPLGLKNVMGYFKDNYAGRYDGALVSKIAKETL